MKEEIQNTTFNISLKTLFTIIAFSFVAIGEYIVLQKEIEEAKELPENQVSRIEFEYSKEKLQNQIDILKEEIRDLKDD
ncbi:MAG: hypothetical protein GOVbin5978_14 [Prokaryotic dsDNA virus sp.]|nr:MAG: hypothetical protein GOVbin5978_14 [Prokaryotic dsDNA virus sp.]|tara:strand:- start:587 stop:823 length:237 start_codon:yes stop_codon:yes gene_type:complete